MRIAQTSDGRYVKVLSPQMQGLIGRLYEEIRQRKETDARHDETLATHENQMELISSQMETMLIRYAEITDILRRLFPEDEPVANIDRALEVNGSVKAKTFISTSTDTPAFTVSNNLLIENLNAEFIQGQSLQDLYNTMDEKVEALNQDVTERMDEYAEYVEQHYAPIEHVNAGGPGVHPYATYELAGFMSPLDKLHHDQMKQKLDTFELPGGILIGSNAPEQPKLMQVWIDTN